MSECFCACVKGDVLRVKIIRAEGTEGVALSEEESGWDRRKGRGVGKEARS